ncbi:DM13 domain-containing protein [Prauserella cavernicola]|uniref:DM13 domain-containing protein n=1 Tax=Prauserella cavernicola TaxID=2800127 RepID=A0A934QV93_9PSEU|nr:DM13 domain-containing protein [Prauserella cavernicola]MBK1787155.1 DM13 domain-containing protein [Prauserella cavernicola]
MRNLMRKPVTWFVTAVVVAGLGVGLALFEPWRAFTSSQLDEPVPVPVAAEAEAEARTGSSAPSTTAPPPPAVLAEGSFMSQEHATEGAARVLELPDGTRILRLEEFSTSDGPDVHVWLSDATAGGDWNKYDDGRYVALGEIKATDGNHNYAIPADADLAGLRSVVIWCDRFNVAFGSAPLEL